MSELTGAAAMVREVDGHRIDRFGLKVAGMRRVRPRSGWLYVDIDLENSHGEVSAGHFVKAIFSGGGRGVRQWVECRIFPRVEFPQGRVVQARELGLEAGFITLMGRLIPSGGHLMVDYDSGGQDQTLAELVARVPPLTSYLGELMFRAGFRGQFKDWYFSEGGHEGPRKLQANKSPNAAAARAAMAEHLRTLRQFVRRPLPPEQPAHDLIAGAIARARNMIKDFANAAPRGNR